MSFSPVIRWYFFVYVCLFVRFCQTAVYCSLRINHTSHSTVITMHTIGSIYYYTLGNLIIIYGLTAGYPWTGKLLFNPVVLDSSSDSMKMNSAELFRAHGDNYYFILSKQYVDNFSRVYIFYTSVCKNI